MPLSKLLVVLAMLASSFLTCAVANQFFKLKEYDDAECTEEPKRIQTALYPVDTCLIVGSLRMKVSFQENDSLSVQAYDAPRQYGGQGCLESPIYDDVFNATDFADQSARCLHLGSNLYVKMVDIFDANAYELGQDENIINAFTRSCRVPDENGFNYFGLYRKNFCYSFELEGASEYFEITEDNGARKIIKRDYKALDCEGPSTAVEYLEGDCSNGHFSYSSAKDPQGTYGALAPNFANPFAEMQPNNPLN